VANVAYALMFLNEKDPEIWKSLAKNVCNQKLVCSLNYYKPLKIAEHYMLNFFPRWDLSTYSDTLFESSREFSTSRQQKSYEKEEYHALSTLLIVDLRLDIHIWVEWENLLIVDYAILPHKVGILLQKKSDSLPFSREASPKHLLKSKVLEWNGWKLLHVEYETFLDMGVSGRDWIQAELNKLIEQTSYRVKEADDTRRDYAGSQFLEQLRAVEISNNVDKDIVDKNIEAKIERFLSEKHHVETKLVIKTSESENEKKKKR